MNQTFNEKMINHKSKKMNQLQSIIKSVPKNSE